MSDLTWDERKALRAIYEYCMGGCGGEISDESPTATRMELNFDDRTVIFILPDGVAESALMKLGVESMNDLRDEEHWITPEPDLGLPRVR